VYGTDVTLNAGNALYFIPLKVIRQNPGELGPERRLDAYEMLADELNRTHLGQGMDIDWHDGARPEVAEAQYLEMCACKTGCLARIVGRLAAIVADQPPAVERAVATYCERLSVAFQIVDDVLDVEHSVGEAGEFGKAFGNDIREGKSTLLVIHALEVANPERRERLLSTVAADDPDEEDVLEAIEIFRETDSVAYSRARAEELADEAVAALEGLHLEPEAESDLREFPRYVIERDR
jgi:geranylgeranyl diphosphate synthase type I